MLGFERECSLDVPEEVVELGSDEPGKWPIVASGLEA
jgi:hypothetical protein